MKKTIFGCTLLIIGTMFDNSFAIAIPFWAIGAAFVLLGSVDDKANK